MSPPPRHPRPSTPHPTVPPPLPLPAPQEEPLEATEATEAGDRLAKRVEPWKVGVGLVMALLGAGAAFAGWNGELAKKSDLAHVESKASTALSTAQADATAQFGALQVQVQDLRSRQSAIEGKLDILINLSTHMVDQASEIARATHARQLPAPSSQP